MAEWKSVRISDAICRLAEQASASSCRSLSQQIEHWARLGATLDAAGITSAQVARLVLGDAASIAMRPAIEPCWLAGRRSVSGWPSTDSPCPAPLKD